MTDMSAEQREVAKLEKEAKEMMEEANRETGSGKSKKKAAAAAEAALANAERRRLLLVHPFAGMHINVRCQAAKAMARWQNEHAPWLPNDVDELSIHEPLTGGASVVLDEVEDDPELIELEAEAAMMVDVDDDLIADGEAMEI